ncbi:MAG: diguanylate phosphodiesterase, partial [Comamonadaceae bacterium]
MHRYCGQALPREREPLLRGTADQGPASSIRQGARPDASALATHSGPNCHHEEWPAPMIFTLVYRSKIAFDADVDVVAIVDSANIANRNRGITGVLLFNGCYFLQMLEGDEDKVLQVFDTIHRDTRHTDVVRLLGDYAPRRKFGSWGMKLLDLQSIPAAMVERPLANLVGWDAAIMGGRAHRIMSSFACGNWQRATGGQLEEHDRNDWVLEERPAPFIDLEGYPYQLPGVQFALQPILDTASGSISCLEVLIRSNTGGSPHDIFSKLSEAELHHLDLHSKVRALELLSRIGVGNVKVAVNLLPRSLTAVPEAVDLLIHWVAEHNLDPEQLIVEVTEDEAISQFDDFLLALKKLRGAGIGVAIDDFGAGHAGLAMLASFQPEKLKIDRQIITGIDADGPRQAIVRAIVGCCRELGISVVAEGVERIEEWIWLRSAGIRLFQGYLFARPK